jgi:hypothetical protein
MGTEKTNKKATNANKKTKTKKITYQKLLKPRKNIVTLSAP